MSNDVYKVINLDDNQFNLDNKQLLNALVLKYANPLISIPFISKDLNNEKIYELCKRANISYDNNNFYDCNGNLLSRDLMIEVIVNELCSSAKVFLESDEDKIYHANMVKYILEKNILPKLENGDKNILTVDDLMAKLYDHNEEKRGRTK